MNEKYFDELEKKIDAIDTCEMLEKVRQEIMEALLKMKEEIEAQIEELAPLMTPPATPLAAVAWIVKYIKLLKKTYDTYVAQLNLIVTRIIRIQDKITNKVQTLGCPEITSGL